MYTVSNNEPLKFEDIFNQQPKDTPPQQADGTPPRGDIFSDPGAGLFTQSQGMPRYATAQPGVHQGKETGYRIRVSEQPQKPGIPPGVRIVANTPAAPAEAPAENRFTLAHMRTLAWNTVKNHKRAAFALPVATLALLYSVQSGMMAHAGDLLGQAKDTVAPGNELEEYYALPKPECILETAFTADVKASASLLVKLTVIDSTNPEDAKAVAEARAKAYADKAYVPPENLTKTGIFDPDAYVMTLPEKPAFLPTPPVDKSEPATSPAAPPDHVNRLPQAGYIASEMPFSICLNTETSMGQEVVEQKSPRHLVVHLDQFGVVFNSKQEGAINDYETNPPQIPNYPEGVPAEQRQLLFPQSEIERVYKFLAPEGKYDAEKKVYVSGASRNPAIQEAMKLIVLQEINRGENGVAMQADAQAAIAEALREAIESQLDEVNAENGTNLSVDDIAINFEGVAASPAEPFAKTVTIPAGEFELHEPNVSYQSNKIEEQATS
jgi:hypothetical protein